MKKMYNSLRLLLVLLTGSVLGANAQTSSFLTPGGPYNYTVPVGVTAITVTLRGGAGGKNSDPVGFPDSAGHGGCVTANVAVVAGQVLVVYVGGKGGDATPGVGGAGGAGGANGGGAGGQWTGHIFAGGGGGGASDLRLASGLPSARLVVAGGGGGAGLNDGFFADNGGSGGTSTGGQGGSASFPYTGGLGGAGGVGGTGGNCSGGCFGSPGSDGTGDLGGDAGLGGAGGGGGGGYGGGGGGDFSGGGGGGSYTGGVGVTSLSDVRGCNTGGGSVTINPYCISGVISGANHVCQNFSNPPLTETVGGGHWTSSSTAIATVGSNSGIVTGVTAGVVNISYSLTPLCFALYSVTVNPAPAAIIAPFSLCKNDTFNVLEDSTAGTWSSTSPSVASINAATGHVIALAAGTTNIVFTLTSTGCTASSPLTVYPLPVVIVGQDSACVGNCVTLTDASTGGAWTSSSPGIASVVDLGTSATICGLSAGTSIISYAFSATSCATSVVFTVNALPSGIAGPAIICLGGLSGRETDITPGGTWSVSPGTGAATIDPVLGDVTGTAVGTITVTYTLPTTCFVTRVLTVNPTPAPITPSAPEVCVGSTIVLSDITPVGSWVSSNPAIASLAGVGMSITVSGLAPGGVAIISYIVNSCPAIVTVTVHPKPTVITGTNPVCQGECVNLFSGGGAGAWSSSAPATGTIDPVTGIFCGLVAGTTTVTYTNTVTGCARNKVVTVNATPVITPAAPMVCVGYTNTLNATPTGGTWTTTSGDLTFAGTTGVITGVTAGLADVTYTANTSCTVNVTVTVNDLPTAITQTTGTNPMCQGTTAHLVSAGSGPGTWISSNVGAQIIGASTGLATGLFGGIVIDTFRETSTGCYVTFSLDVTPNPTFAVGGAPPTVMCLGTSAAPTGTGLGTWSTSAPLIIAVTTVPGPGPGGTLDALALGSANICYTSNLAPGTCQICQTIDVIPTAAAIAGPNTVCTGSNITLTDASAPGTWTSSNPAAASVVAATGVVTGVSTVGSPVTITFTVGTCTATKVVSVNQSPNPIIAPTVVNICQGLSHTFCTTSPGPGFFTWVSGNTAVATLAPAGLCATATGVGAGTSIISYLNNFNGCYSSATLNVTSSIGAIAGPDFVCTGTTATEFHAFPAGTWSSSNIGVASVVLGPALSTTVTPVTTGTFTLTFASGSGCSVSKVMTVNASPVNTVIPLGSTNLCPGGLVDLTASTGPGYTYQWFNGGPIAGATNSTYLAGSAGAYFVTVTSAGPCSVNSPATNVTMNPVNATIFPSGAYTSCVSAGTVLTASPAPSYQWQKDGVAIPGATASIYTPTVSGSYAVVESNTFGCTGISPAVTATLVASPAGVVTLSGPLNICAGGSVLLTSDAGPGYTYQWYNGSLASPIAGATNITYTATTAGNYFVVDQNTTGCGATSAISNVRVSPLPFASITNPTSPIFCTGGSVVLSAPLSVANTFQWYKNGIAIAGATNTSYVAGATGNYTVVIDSPASGCLATSPIKVVTVVGAPTVTFMSPSSFCWGSSAHIAAVVTTGAGTVGYQWSLGGTPLAGATNATYDATVSGTYKITISVGGGTCSDSSLDATVHENPLPNPLVAFDGINVKVQSYYTSYVWYYNSIIIPGANTWATAAIGNGHYKVKVTDTNGCQSVSADLSVTTWNGHTSGINQTTATDISIYPNPAQNELRIDAPVTVRAVIYSIDGRTMIDQQAAKTMNISQLANGIYTIKLFDATGSMIKVQKFVKDGN
jgi:uncharacterized protein YjdB